MNNLKLFTSIGSVHNVVKNMYFLQNKLQFDYKTHIISGVSILENSSRN